MPKIEKNAWLNFAPLISYESYEFWDTPDFPEILPQDNDTFITVEDVYVGRLDLIAYDYYQDSNLWWVIALANKIDQIPTGVSLNMTLRIPNKSYVDSLLSKAEG